MSIQLAFWAQTVKGTRSCEREGLVGSPPGDQPGEQVFECLHGQWVGFVSGGESVARPGIGWRRHGQSVEPLLVAAGGGGGRVRRGSAVVEGATQRRGRSHRPNGEMSTCA